MPNVPTGSTYKGPKGFSTPGLSETVGLVAGGLISAYQLAQGQVQSHSQRIAAAHQIGAAIFSTTPLGPFIALEGELVGAAGGAFEASLAKRRYRRIKRNLAHAYRGALGRGAGELFGARYALSRVGVNPETVLPLAPPVQVAPARSIDVPLQRAASGKVRAGTGFRLSLPAVYAPDPIASGTPYYDPETRAATTEQTIALKYGEGPGADDQRTLYGEQLVRELASRPFPGAGLVPLPFAILHKGV